MNTISPLNFYDLVKTKRLKTMGIILLLLLWVIIIRMSISIRSTRNADLYLYASRQDAFQGSCRGSDERSQQQQQNDPHCFQSLSLD